MKMYAKKIRSEYMNAFHAQHRIEKKAKEINILLGAALLFCLADCGRPIYNNVGRVVGYDAMLTPEAILAKHPNMVLSGGNWRDATCEEIKYLLRTI